MSVEILAKNFSLVDKGIFVISDFTVCRSPFLGSVKLF